MSKRDWWGIASATAGVWFSILLGWLVSSFGFGSKINEPFAMVAFIIIGGIGGIVGGIVGGVIGGVIGGIVGGVIGGIVGGIIGGIVGGDRRVIPYTIAFALLFLAAAPLGLYVLPSALDRTRIGGDQELLAAAQVKGQNLVLPRPESRAYHRRFFVLESAATTATNGQNQEKVVPLRELEWSFDQTMRSAGRQSGDIIRYRLPVDWTGGKLVCRRVFARAEVSLPAATAEQPVETQPAPPSSAGD